MKRNLKWISVGLITAALLALPLKASAQVKPSYNYVGIGGGDEGFVVNGKITVSDNLSIRPWVATDFDFNDGEDVDYVLPVTYDFNALDAEGNFYPFLGAGIGGQLGDTSTIEFAVTGGLDYHLSDQWVANGTINYLPFADGEDISFSVGIGYMW